MSKTLLTIVAAALLFVVSAQAVSPVSAAPTNVAGAAVDQVRHRTAKVAGVEVFYRETGPADAPVLLLLHGFPTSSHMFRDLIPRLAQQYRVIAPDYPGFGYSAAPQRDRFAYTFDNYAGVVDGLVQQLGLQRYALYVMDYGAPIGFRLAAAHPERISAIVIQNGNAYDEGIGPFWDPIKAYWRSGAKGDREAIRWLTSLKATKWQYTNGVPDSSLVSPDAWTLDQALLDRPGNQEVQLDLFYDYRTNLPLYPQWQRYFREYRPPMLVLWGKNDEIFLAAGAAPYKRDNPNAQVHLIDTGHFALETHAPQIATLIRTFLDRNIVRDRKSR